MFGHDDNEQAVQDTDAQGAMPDAPVGAPGATVVDSSMPAGFGGGFAAAAPADNPTAAAPAPALPMAAPAGDPDDLMEIKQQALQQLSPLVGHLDQSPEEKFRTTMMMIQASDNQDLIKDAYAAAQQIQDEKTRAQALLDIVNEINYFTQHQSQ